jgi:anti-sigma factor RsiW
MNAPELPEETSKVEDLSAWIDGELSNDTMEKLDREVAHDPELRAEATRLKAAWDLLDHLPKPVASPDLTNRTMAMLQICETTTQRFEPTTHFTSVGPRDLFQFAAWWALLALLVIVGFGIARTLEARQVANTDQSRFLWLDMAAVAPEFRGDIEFLKWLAQPGRFGSDNP